LIDTDCGIDDAECIFTSLYYLEVVAITTVMGNTTVENAATNVAKVLQLANR
jgi:inosine-uridine nucleoside N-ribohydrolase